MCAQIGISAIGQTDAHPRHPHRATRPTRRVLLRRISGRMRLNTCDQADNYAAHVSHGIIQGWMRGCRPQ